MSALAGTLLAILISAGPPNVSVHLDASPKLFATVKAGLLRERPSLVFVADPASATLAFAIENERGGFMLSTRSEGGAIEKRQLGAELDAAARLAVLLCLRRIRELEERPTATAQTTTSSAAAIAATPAATATVAELAAIASSTAAAARTPIRSVTAEPAPVLVASDHELDLAVFVVPWRAPLSARTGLSAAYARRFRPLAFGLRASASGLCCAAEGEGLEVTSTFFALYAEARARFDADAFGLEGALAAGVTYDHIRARPTIYTAPGDTESLWSTGARAAISFDAPLSGALHVAITTGVYAFAQDISAQLPPELARGRTSAKRGQILPFLELGARVFDF